MMRSISWMTSRFLIGCLSALVQARFFQEWRHLVMTLIAYWESARILSLSEASPAASVALRSSRIAVSSPRLFVPSGQPPASQWSSSTTHAHPEGPGLDREEPSTAAVIVMSDMVSSR